MEEIYLAIFIVSLVVMILTMSVIWAIVNYKRRQNDYNREKNTMQLEFERQLFQSQIEVQEETYGRLAKELHDNVGQLLSSSKILLGLAQKKLSEVPEALNLAEETLGKAILELRNLSKSMDSEWLEQFDFTENLSAEIQRLRHDESLQIEFLHDRKLTISPQKQIILFRIIQEALQNVIKHAGARHVRVGVTETADELKVQLADDGRGFTEAQAGGLGIRNMKHRAALLGGHIAWQHLREGTCVELVLPVNSIE